VPVTASRWRRSAPGTIGRTVRLIAAVQKPIIADLRAMSRSTQSVLRKKRFDDGVDLLFYNAISTDRWVGMAAWLHPSAVFTAARLSATV
jgi:hypothetical protein